MKNLRVLNRFPQDSLSIFVGCALLMSTASDLAAEEVRTLEERALEAPTSLMEEIIVWGRGQAQKGKVRSAAEGLVGYADFSTRPLQRVGELVEVVPGMVATQHSGEGKANQFFLRGMNLDHGTDFSVYFEGMPVNLRAHAHGQGYLDLNFLIPEVISTVAFQKGPYHPDRGDFSTAGSSTLSLYDVVDPFIEITAGSDGYRRLVSAGSFETGTGDLLMAVEALRNEGPWQNPADVRKDNLILKHSGYTGPVARRIVLSYYENE